MNAKRCLKRIFTFIYCLWFFKNKNKNPLIEVVDIFTVIGTNRTRYHYIQYWLHSYNCKAIIRGRFGGARGKIETHHGLEMPIWMLRIVWLAQISLKPWSNVNKCFIIFFENLSVSLIYLWIYRSATILIYLLYLKYYIKWE